MAPSQLKSLKASLRQQGLLGPQQSKKDRQRRGKGTAQQHEKRAAALAEVRERFRPFEVKQLARGNKYEIANDTSRNAVVGRPGVTKGRGEEVRRGTLLKEMQQRKKVGGVVDRRFGEDNPTMTPEDRALQRFVREKQSQGRKSALFDLEDEADEDELTHRGHALFALGGNEQDDFDDAGLNGSESDTDREGIQRGTKRLRLDGHADEQALSLDDTNGLEDRPKTKKEVMQEVIAKSKLHRYERQKAKEEDEDLRDELDADVSSMLTTLRKGRSAVTAADNQPATLDPSINPDRAALLAGKDRNQADREYDLRLRQMAQEAKAQPTVRTKTDEERAQEEAERLKELEEKRLRRMRGESVSDDQHNDGADDDGPQDDFDDDNLLGRGLSVLPRKDLDVEDEDEFELDTNLIAEGSDVELESPSDSASDADANDSDDREFVAGLLSEEDVGRIKDPSTGPSQTSAKGTKDVPTLAFTYPCPQTHQGFKEITKDTAYLDLNTVIQRIRALHHPRLAEENKRKLGQFSAVLVEHIAYLAHAEPRPPFVVLEQLIRHVHSLAKSHPIDVSLAYRAHLHQIHTERPLALDRADLIMLTGIASTFPTSDLFHPVATPAMMTLARFIGQKVPGTLRDLVIGTYACTLCIRFQSLSQRYVPEVANFLLQAIFLLTPIEPPTPFGTHPVHDTHASLRIRVSGKPPIRTARLRLEDIEDSGGSGDPGLKQALLAAVLRLVETVMQLWAAKDSFVEIFTLFTEAVAHLRRPMNTKHLASSTKTHLEALEAALTAALHKHARSRKPLELHHHRPRPIRTQIPKFETDFHPDKHYDVDAARAEGARLRAAHRRERKGAVRELRKDAAFVAREGLKEQKEREAAYAAKYRRLVAQIQGEEGKEGNRYEREKRARRSQR